MKIYTSKAELARILKIHPNTLSKNVKTLLEKHGDCFLTYERYARLRNVPQAFVTFIIESFKNGMHVQ